MLKRVTVVGAVLGLGLGACANVSRFDGAQAPRASSAPVYQTPTAEPPVQASPSVATAPIQTQALPPPGGQQPPTAPQSPATATLPGAVAQPVEPTLSGPSTGVAQSQSQGGVTPMTGGGRVATLGPASSPAAARSSGASRDNVVGGWTAREATGSSCKVTLSSSPALDLYRASAAGCANKDLQKVIAWDYRDGDVYLYQSGGAVAARMRVNDTSSISGSMSRSGAGLSLSR